MKHILNASPTEGEVKQFESELHGFFHRYSTLPHFGKVIGKRKVRIMLTGCHRKGVSFLLAEQDAREKARYDLLAEGFYRFGTKKITFTEQT